MLMLPPVSRIVGPDRAASRSRRTPQVDETVAAEEIGAARRDRVEPVRPASAVDEKFRHDQEERRPQDAPSRRAARPYAPLVAQLIATTLGLGQTRPRRRAAVSEAVAAYRRVRQKPGRSYGVV